MIGIVPKVSIHLTNPRMSGSIPDLKAYVEEDRRAEEIVEMGFASETVQRVIRMVDYSEYKRRQAPPGVRITQRAFGRDRRLPITNWFKG